MGRESENKIPDSLLYTWRLKNIRKFIRYLLSCNLGEVLTMFLASLFYLPNPLTPIQILFVNLATDGLPAIALGIDGSI